MRFAAVRRSFDRLLSVVDALLEILERVEGTREQDQRLCPVLRMIQPGAQQVGSLPVVAAVHQGPGFVDRAGHEGHRTEHERETGGLHELPPRLCQTLRAGVLSQRSLHLIPESGQESARVEEAPCSRDSRSSPRALRPDPTATRASSRQGWGGSDPSSIRARAMVTPP